MSENDTDACWELPQLDMSEFDEVLHEDDDVIPVSGEIEIADEESGINWEAQKRMEEDIEEFYDALADEPF